MPARGRPAFRSTPLRKAVTALTVATVVTVAMATGTAAGGTGAQGAGGATGGAAGAGWIPFGPPAGLLATLALDGAGNILTSTSESGVYRSDDLGVSWQLSSQGMGTETARALAVDAAGGEQVAVTATGVFARAGGGAAWRLLARTALFGAPGSGADVLALSGGAATPSWVLARGRQVFHSGDGGRTWHRVLVTRNEVTSILADPDDAGSVFAGTDGTDHAGELLHSGDGGSTWEPVTAAEPLPGNPGISPFADGVGDLAAVAATTAAAPLAARPPLPTFPTFPTLPTIPMIPTTPTMPAAAAIPAAAGGGGTRPATLFAVASMALLRSGDGGATWQLVTDLPAPAGTQLSVQSIAAGAGPGARLDLLYEAFDGSTGAQLFGALASDDLGATWSRLDRRGLAAGTHLAVQPGTGNLFALQTDRIAIGLGQGRRWSASRLGDQFCGGPSGGEARLAFAAGGSRPVMLAGGRLFASHDSGAHLAAVSPDDEPGGSCAVFRDLTADAASGTWFALSDRAVWSSADGVQWQAWPHQLPNFDPPSFSLAALVGGQLLAGTCGIARSADGGRTWQETLPCDDGTGRVQLVRRLVVDPGDANRVFALVTSDQPTGFPEMASFLAVTEDAGRSWNRLGFAADALAAGRSRTPLLWALDGQGFFRGTGEGSRWIRVSTFSTGTDPAADIYLGTRADIGVDPRDASVLYVVRWDGAWSSADGGRSFTPLDAGLQADALRLVRIWVDPTGARQLYAAGAALFTRPAG